MASLWVAGCASPRLAHDRLSAPEAAHPREIGSPTSVSTITGIPLPRRIRETLHFTAVSGPLFLATRAPSPDDVYQGDLDDCGLLAMVSSLAAARPEAISEIMSERADGSFDVRLHPNGERATIVVSLDRLFPTTDRGVLVFAGETVPDYVTHGARHDAQRNTRPLWPEVIEKALAVTHGGYSFLDQERPGIDLEILGGSPFTVDTRALSADATAAIVVRAIESRLPALFGNADASIAERWGIQPRHAYAIVATRVTDAGARRVSLRDPRGRTNAVLGAMRPESPATFEIDLKDAVASFRHLRIVGDEPAAFKELQAIYEAGVVLPKARP